MNTNLKGVKILTAYLADIHLGTKLSQIDYLKSLDMFLDMIKKHTEPCHCIFVLGDLFDHRLSIDESKFASLFLLNLVCNNCGRNGKTHVPVHFIHGTYTHDYEQYEIYLNILSKIDNVEVFYTKTACSGKLSNGMSVLYLPQEYGEIDYTKAFDNTYDIIVGHGPMSSTIKQPCRSTQYEIMHSAEQLGSISKLCVFGHYHEYTEFGSNVFYAGSMLRWKYNEDTPKQFFLCDDNFNVTTTLNPYALEYKTIEIKEPEELRDIISRGITTPHRFIIKTNNENVETYHAIMNTNKKNPNIKYKISSEENDDNTLTTQTIEMPTESNSDTLVLGPIPSLISYISEKYNIDTSKEIHEYDEKISKGV